MIPSLILLLLGMTALLILTSLVQSLYQESMRLRTRESACLTFFRERVEDAIGKSDAYGLLAMSIVKQALVSLQGVLLFGMFLKTASAAWEAAASACVATLALMLFACHLVPQLLYRKTSGYWLLPLAPWIRFLMLISAPAAGLLNFLFSLSELSEPEEEKQEMPTPSEHMEALIEASHEEGLIEDDEKKLLQSAASFGDKTVREVMTPRPNIVAIQAHRTLEDLRGLVVKEQYSRIPVYEKTIDEVCGFVHVRDMFEVSESDRPKRVVRELVRILRIVPETKPVDDLLREMQKDGAHMSVVVDEYGNTAGLVTMEDLVEQIVGEIHDEHDPERDIHKLPDGGYVLSGNFEVDRLEDLVGYAPDEETESTTVGGLVTEWLGRVPSKGESGSRDGVCIEVLSSSDLRVEQVKVSRSDQAPPVNGHA
jgi:CBS domain containing-hemolysin-like protein